jgi:hypothetical protein
MEILDGRRAKRYPLIVPVQMQVDCGPSPFLFGVTRNISSKGILCECGTVLELGRRVSFDLTLAQSQGCEVVLHCIGSVVRAQAGQAAGEFQMAITIDHYTWHRGAPRLRCGIAYEG